MHTQPPRPLPRASEPLCRQDLVVLGLALAACAALGAGAMLGILRATHLL